MVTVGELVVQVTTLRGLFVESATRHDSNIGVKMLLKMSKNFCFSFKHEVLSGETLFHRIGPRVSQDRTFSKTIVLNQTNHTLCEEGARASRVVLWLEVTAMTTAAEWQRFCLDHS